MIGSRARSAAVRSPGGVNVGVAGLGYVGLPTALGFASYGHRVLGFDVRPELRHALERAESPVHEPGLAELLSAERASGRFHVVASWDRLVDGSQVIFLCLPTPSGRSGRIDLAPLLAGARSLGRALRGVRGRRLIVVKSTVVPGTTEGRVRPELERASGLVGEELGVAVNPEFVAEGSMVDDVLRPERVVLGITREVDEALLRQIYAPFRAPVIALPPAGAELVKYASNAFLATKITLANEISRVAERVGVDVDRILEAVGRDSRIGPKFLTAGPGFGGSCFEKDVRAILAEGRRRGVALPTLSAVMRSNDAQAAHAFGLAEQALGGSRRRRIAVLGLSFKPGTDDVRGSRALPIVQAALDAGAIVRVHDPVALEKFRESWRSQHGGSGRGVQFCEEVEQALEGADAAIVHTPWPEYRKFPPSWTGRMRSPLVVDLRRALPEEVRKRRDFLWVGLGTPSAIGIHPQHADPIAEPNEGSA